MTKVIISFLLGMVLVGSVGAGEVVQFAGMRFDGVDDFVSFGTNVNPVLSTSYVVELVFKSETVSRRPQLLIGHLGSAPIHRPLMRVLLGGSSTLRVDVWDSNDLPLSVGAVILLPLEEHSVKIVVSEKGGRAVSIDLLVDGVRSRTAIRKGVSLRSSSLSELIVGSNFTGVISELLVYPIINTVISPN